jgi:hypothetical protein
VSHIYHLQCCGINELADIDSDQDPVQSLMTVQPHCQAFILFSDVQENNADYSCGKQLVAEIKKHKLGTCTQLRPSENPNSGNMVKPWLWKVNNDRLEAYQKRVRKANPDAYRDPYDNYWNSSDC